MNGPGAGQLAQVRRIANGRTFRAAAAWAAAAGFYGAAQGLSAWAGQRAAGTRPQYQRFDRPAFSPPGPVFPVVWSALNLTTATSAWRLWRVQAGQPDPAAQASQPDPAAQASQPDPAAQASQPDPAALAARGARTALAWWTGAVAVRSGYVPLEFGARQFWLATADSALLCAVMSRYAWLARRADPAAAALAVPEIAWTAFATVLSAAVARRNATDR
jgi:tryptophan-rich sensory protein